MCGNVLLDQVNHFSYLSGRSRKFLQISANVKIPFRHTFIAECVIKLKLEKYPTNNYIKNVKITGYLTVSKLISFYSQTEYSHYEK